MRAFANWGKTAALLAAFVLVGLTQIGCDSIVRDIARDQCRDACQDTCDQMNASQAGSCDQTWLDDCNAQCDQISG